MSEQIVYKQAKQLSNGVAKRQFKVRTGTCKFVNKQTQKDAKKAQYINHIADKKIFNEYDVIRYPLNSESVVKQQEENNCLVFIVKREATKPEIKAAFKKIYGEDVKKCNTLITPLGQKKAFITLAKEGKAAEIANTYELPK